MVFAFRWDLFRKRNLRSFEVPVMSSPKLPGAVMYPAAERNKPHILQCLQRYVRAKGREGETLKLLEIGAGTGQHCVHFAPHFPHVIYQPTELNPELIESIDAYRMHVQLPNIKEAAVLDITQPADTWLNGSLSPNSLDYVLSINMIHISPWTCTEGLFEGAAYILKPKGYLFMYGPFAVDGNITPDSNVNFDRSLRTQNAEWGLRDITRQLVPLAARLGLKLANTHDLPANNKFLAWLKHNQE
uniref:Methyltransferase type 12 domain-containing protein n=1 Tax=Graphocephala atropunctata TaxID=36148 RepID=A0A1B6MDJ3_9HEMI